MPRYEKGTQGKLIVQDWTVLANYSEVNVLRWLSPRQCAALISLATFLEWRTRYSNLPEDEDIDAFASETKFNLMTDVLFCQLMIACITDDLDVQEAMVQMLLANQDFRYGVGQIPQPGVPGTGQLPDGTAQQPILGYNPTCDKDKAYGNIVKMVDDAVQNVIDLFEKIELQTDNQEMLNQLVDLIPGVGLVADEIIINDLSAFLDNVRDWMNDAFLAADTTALRTQTYCDLLCLWVDGCDLSIEEIRDYFWDKTTALVPEWSDAFASAVKIFEALNDSSSSFGVGIWHAMLGAQFGLGYYLNDFFGLSFDAIRRHSALGVPSDDWMGECDDCPNEIVVFADTDAPPGEDTLYDVVDGTNYEIRAVGTWNGGSAWTGDADGETGVFHPGSLLPTAPLYSLVGRVGLTGGWLFIGTVRTLPVATTGRLYLAMNDAAGAYSDNSGSLIVTISEA